MAQWEMDAGATRAQLAEDVAIQTSAVVSLQPLRALVVAP